MVDIFPVTHSLVEYLIKSIRIGFISEEAEIHKEIKRVFDENNIRYIHEYKLGKGSRIDFYIEELKLGIEVKKKRPIKKQLEKQVERYTSFDAIENVLIVSEGKADIKNKINNKEIKTISLNKLWF